MYNGCLSIPLKPNASVQSVDSLQRAACKVGLNASTGEHASLHMGFQALTCRAFSHWGEIRAGRNRGASMCQQHSLHGELSDLNLVSPQYAAPQVSVRLESVKASLILKIVPTSRQCVCTTENFIWMWTVGWQRPSYGAGKFFV